MNFKQILGLLAIAVGIALIIFVIYGKGELEEGREKISSAKKQVKQTNQLFSLNPISKEVGQGISGDANKKIAAGERSIEEYEMIFKWSQIGGIALIVVGAGLVLFCRTRKRKH